MKLLNELTRVFGKPFGEVDYTVYWIVKRLASLHKGKNIQFVICRRWFSFGFTHDVLQLLIGRGLVRSCCWLLGIIIPGT